MIEISIPGRSSIKCVDYYFEFLWYYKDCELETKQWFVDNIKEDWHIFDAGANIGYYSILFSLLAPQGKVYAFEPTETIAKLLNNIKYNNCENIQTFKTALGTKTSKEEVEIPIVYPSILEKKSYEFISIDAFVKINQISKIDCIKIDVDTFNFDVLLGSQDTLDRFNPWVVVEITEDIFNRYKIVQALNWLTQRGYNDILCLDGENFVLKRDSKSKKSVLNSLNIVFSSKALPPVADKLEESIEQKVEVPIFKYNQCEDTFCSKEKDRLDVITPIKLWHSAITYDLNNKQNNFFDKILFNFNKKETLFNVVYIQLLVQSGKIGIGVNDGKDFVSQERIVPESTEVQQVKIKIYKEEEAKYINFRQVNYKGEKSHFSIFKIILCKE